MEIKRTNFYFLLYLLTLLVFGIFFLFEKHNGGTDSSIAEWLINYQGGFTRRGFPGEISFRLAYFLDLNIRFVIFLLQSSIYTIYIFLVYRFFKNYIKNIFVLFVIFSPIFLLYPVAEIESLGRKEIFLFVFFITLLNLSSKYYPQKFANLYVLFVLPIICLIYEEIILFAPFILCVLVIKNNSKKFFSFLKLILFFIPSIMITLYFLFNPLSQEGHNLMSQALMTSFGERCYLACNMLVTNNIDVSNFSGMLTHIWSEPSIMYVGYIFRYSLIFIIGFLPLHFLCFYSTFIKKIFFVLNFKKVISLIFILYIPIILLFVFGGDWGRWIHMTCVFSTLFYFYLFKNKIIKVDLNKMNKKVSLLINKKVLLYLTFVIFAFGWTPQTLYKGDVSSFPGYRIPYKAIKLITR